MVIPLNHLTSVTISVYAKITICNRNSTMSSHFGAVHNYNEFGPVNKNFFIFLYQYQNCKYTVWKSCNFILFAPFNILRGCKYEFIRGKSVPLRDFNCINRNMKNSNLILVPLGSMRNSKGSLEISNAFLKFLRTSICKLFD